MLLIYIFMSNYTLWPEISIISQHLPTIFENMIFTYTPVSGFQTNFLICSLTSKFRLIKQWCNGLWIFNLFTCITYFITILQFMVWGKSELWYTVTNFFWMVKFYLCLMVVFFNRQGVFLWVLTVLSFSPTCSFIRPRQISYRGF